MDGVWQRWAGQQLQAAQAAYAAAEQQQQLQQQAGSSGRASSDSSSSAADSLMRANLQVKVAVWASQCGHTVHDEVTVNGVRLVGEKHSRHKEQG